MMRRERISHLLLACVFLFGNIGYAQVTTGTISGSVKDTSGAVLPGTKVEIVNEQTGISRTVQTDAAGHYSALALSLGNYRVTASVSGFQAEVRRGITLTLGREAVVDFQLTVGAVTQTVEVTGEAPLVESTTSSLGSLVDDRTIRDLPLNGRSYDQLALLQPGVIAMGGGTGQGGLQGLMYGAGKRFSVAGGRSDTNSFLVDGTDINDQANSTPGGAAGNNLGVDAIREFRILTNSFSAEYGRSAGSVISAVTRSGTNQLHGSAFEFLRNSELDARNFFDRGATPPPFKRNQFGGVAGGPIKKDKTFFFSGYEGMRQGLGSTLISSVPTLAVRQGILPTGVVPVSPAVAPFFALYPVPNGRDFGDGTAEFSYAPTIVSNENYVIGRVDHQVNDKTSIFGRYSYDGDSVISPDVAFGFQSVERGRRQYLTLQANSILSATVLNNFRFAYNRTFQNLDDLPTIPIPSQLSFVPGQVIGALNVGGQAIGLGQGTARTLTTIGTNNSVPRLWGYNLFEWGDDFSVVKGKHSLKIGAVIERVRDNTAQNTSLRGTYTFANLGGLVAARPTNLQAVSPGQNAFRGLRQTILGAYVQDDINVTSRLTVNLGLRWEAVTDPTEVNGKISNILTPLDQPIILGRFFKVSKKTFGPRVGFAWRLNDSGKTVLRAGGGIFHNPILPYVYAVNVAKIPPFFTLSSVPNPNFPDGFLQLGTASKPQVFTIAPNVDELAKTQYNLSIEQQISGTTVVELAYVGAKANHVMRFSEQNYPNFTVLPDGRKFYPAGAPRRNPNLADVHWMTSDGNALYNGFTITVKRKSSSGLQYQAFYTLSKALDTISGTAGADTIRDGSFSQDPDDHKRDWGPSAFDARHNFVFTVTYPVPFKFSSAPVQTVLGGWSFSGTGTFTAGQPFTPRLPFNNSRDGNSQAVDRPDLKPGANNNPILGGPDRYYDPTVFSLPLAGTYGNLGRNTIIGPRAANVDISLEKMFQFRERANVVFRAEFFNLMNHANFGLPNTIPLSTTGTVNGSAGRITSTVNSSRQIQLGLKINF